MKPVKVYNCTLNFGTSLLTPRTVAAHQGYILVPWWSGQGEQLSSSRGLSYSSVVVREHKFKLYSTIVLQCYIFLEYYSAVQFLCNVGTHS